jgi:outer membrane protein assembly factor BamA
LTVFVPVSVAAGGRETPAILQVSGLGLLRDHEMRLTLEEMLGKGRGPTLGANAIEDTAFLLLSILNEEGFLTPSITVRVKPGEGGSASYRLDQSLEVSLPSSLQAREIHFDVRTGLRSYVDQVVIEGLSALPAATGVQFFKPNGTLIGTRAARAYSPAKVRRSTEQLRDELRQRGYAQAQVAAERIDHVANGPVTLRVRVSEGPLWIVSAVRFEGAKPEEVELKQSSWQKRPWNPVLQQNLTEEIRGVYCKKGYADVTVRIEAEPGAVVANKRAVVVAALIAPGKPVKVGVVRFVGNQHTDTTMLRRRVEAKTGDPLDPLKMDQARYRLARLGVFDSVNLNYEPAQGDVRDPVYVLREGPRYDVDLLAGYGSYEQLRGGFEIRQMDLFGLAHQSQLKFVESMKSTQGEYSYTVPELFGESIDGTARAFGLQRKEIAFERAEYGVNFTLKRQIPWFGAMGTLGY